VLFSLYHLILPSFILACRSQREKGGGNLKKGKRGEEEKKGRIDSLSYSPRVLFVWPVDRGKKDPRGKKEEGEGEAPLAATVFPFCGFEHRCHASRKGEEGGKW